jgi:hypothetical protein
VAGAARPGVRAGRPAPPRPFRRRGPCTTPHSSSVPGPELLTLTYMEYREAVDDARFAALPDDWIAANPPYARRRFDASARRIEVREEVAGGAGQPVPARLLLHPGYSVEPCAGRVSIRRGAAAPTLCSATPVRVEEARWFPDFGMCRPTLQLVLDYGPAPCAGGFVLAAADPGAGGE